MKFKLNSINDTQSHQQLSQAYDLYLENKCDLIVSYYLKRIQKIEEEFLRFQTTNIPIRTIRLKTLQVVAFNLQHKSFDKIFF